MIKVSQSKKKSGNSINFKLAPLFVCMSCALFSMQVLADAGDSKPNSLEDLKEGGLEISASGQAIYRTGLKDPFDNGEDWVWATSANGPTSLSIAITKTQDWNQTSAGKFTDKTSTTLWIAGGIVGAFGKTALGAAKQTSAFTDYDYSSTASGNSLNVTVGEGVTFMAKFFGGKNDLGGGLGDSYSEQTAHLGDANDNTVVIKTLQGATLYEKITYGGRSAGLDQIAGEVHKGFETNNNKVYFIGTLLDDSGNSKQAIEFNNTGTDRGDSSITIIKGIFGAEGYETNANLVSIESSLIVAGYENARKLGIVGGRATYYMRTNDKGEVLEGGNYSGIELKDGNNIKTVQNNDTVKDVQYASIANENVVTINNSYIGYRYTNDWYTPPTSAGGVTIYGGWAVGQAKNNIVAIKDSVVNGNVIGALEMSGQLRTSSSSFRTLDANLVSLFNTKLERGSSIYGTATADGYAEYQAGLNPDGFFSKSG